MRSFNLVSTRCTGFLIGLSDCCITILLLGDPYRFGSGSTASGLEAGFFLSFLGLFHYFKGWKNSSFGSNFGRFFFGIASGLGAPLVILSEPNTIMRGIALVGVMTVLLLIYVFGLLFQQN